MDPDMIVVDWHDTMRMADLRNLPQDFPGISTAIIVDEASTVQVRLLLNAGALGVIPRTLDPKLIVPALEIVMLGATTSRRAHWIPRSSRHSSRAAIPKRKNSERARDSSTPCRSGNSKSCVAFIWAAPTRTLRRRWASAKARSKYIWPVSSRSWARRTGQRP
jgi:DNA-binding NarL/FixJ family response regulator